MREDVARLGPAGRRLWDAVIAEHGDILGPGERVILVEACRTKDRCDQLDGTGDDVEATRQASALRSLLAGLRLPDPRTGKRPRKAPARGVYRPRA